jgi:hypothetical protein
MICSNGMGRRSPSSASIRVVTLSVQLPDRVAQRSQRELAAVSRGTIDLRTIES